MDSLKPVARVTLAEQVATQLAGMINAGKWKPGDKLPSEMELCKALNIGRSTLREALKSLAFIGLVRMRHGEGTFVAERTDRLLDRIFAKGLLRDEQAFADVAETRLVLETELAALAADRISSPELASLRQLMDRMEGALESEGGAFSDLDLLFHLHIAECSKNPVLQQLMAPIQELVREWIGKSQQLPGLRLNACRQHRAILDALEQGKPDRARKAMREHLQTFMRSVALLEKVTAPEPLAAP